MTMRQKIVLIGVAQILGVIAVLFACYYYDTREKVQQQYLAKARAVLLTAESAREEMGKKWGQGRMALPSLPLYLTGSYGSSKACRSFRRGACISG